MSTPTNVHDEEYAALLAAYALGEQDSDTVRTIEAHLERCAQCRETLGAYLAIARCLPLSVPLSTPPPHLRERVLKRVGQATASPAPRSVPRLAPRRWHLSWQAIGLALNVLLLMALLFWNIGEQQERQALISRQQRSWALAVQILNTPDIQPYQLSSSAANTAASGTLWFAPGKDQGCLVVQGLPPLPNNHVYQFWLLRGEQRVSGGTFRVDPEGNGWLLVRHTFPLDSYAAVEITVEPAGGSAQPSSPRLLDGNL